MSFTAKYPGECADCGSDIVPGDDVSFDRNDDLVHRVCPDQPDDVAMGTLCDRCFCYHAGECA
jgi:hypothetical protein